MMRIGVTGGIGSGKSTVCRLFGVLGIPVYDSDARAKKLMSEDGRLMAEITELFGERAYADGVLDRAYISSRVFTDPQLLAVLNAIVHPAVGCDFLKWCEQQGAKYVILESAILFESGFDKYADRTITVSAPESERIERTTHRDEANVESVRARIANQMTDAQREARADYVIRNDEDSMITDQVLRLHKIFMDMNL